MTSKLTGASQKHSSFLQLFSVDTFISLCPVKWNWMTDSSTYPQVAMELQTVSLFKKLFETAYFCSTACHTLS